MKELTATQRADIANKAALALSRAEELSAQLARALKDAEDAMKCEGLSKKARKHIRVLRAQAKSINADVTVHHGAWRIIRTIRATRRDIKKEG